MTTKQLTSPTSVRLEPELKVWLLQKAHKEKRSFGNILNMLIQHCKDVEEGKKEFIAQLQNFITNDTGK